MWQFFALVFFVFILIRFEQKLVLFFTAYTTARMNEPLFNGALRPQVQIIRYDVLFIAEASFMLRCIWTITKVHIYTLC